MKKEFKVGQKIAVRDDYVAKSWGLDEHARQGYVGVVVDVVNRNIEPYVQVDFSNADGYNGAWNVPFSNVELVEDGKFELVSDSLTPFQRISEMNAAFGNPKGDYSKVDWDRIRKQYVNIFDEYCEGLEALGFSKLLVKWLKDAHTGYIIKRIATYDVNPLEVRDALADIQVFKDGALHLMGVDGDADMHAVIDGVMTRFIKDEDDLADTIAMHARKGVLKVYFEGEYPTMVMKSSEDQPDAPKGKFLKSASYTNTVFPVVPCTHPDTVVDEACEACMTL
jgi:hypothetical protein